MLLLDFECHLFLLQLNGGSCMGNHTPTLRNLAIKVLAQTASSSACERNWSTFALIHTKQRNRLAYPKLQQLVFCYYNMKLKIRDMQAESDKVAEKNYLDLLRHFSRVW